MFLRGSDSFIILISHSYTLFSIGNLKPLFAYGWSSCWGSNPTDCQKTWVQGVDYLEVAGIIVGQILVGAIGDWLGRRWGLIQDAMIMFLGLIMLTASWGVTLSKDSLNISSCCANMVIDGWVICYALSLLFYGVGVGGEYPMTATSSMECVIWSNSPTIADLPQECRWFWKDLHQR